MIILFTAIIAYVIDGRSVYSDNCLRHRRSGYETSLSVHSFCFSVNHSIHKNYNAVAKQSYNTGPNIFYSCGRS